MGAIRATATPLKMRATKRMGTIPCAAIACIFISKIGPAGLVEDIAFEGKGCAISMASASMMTDLVLGKGVKEAKVLANAFYQLAKGEAVEASLLPEDREQIEVMAGVSEFPMRVKCATLAWHTFEAAFEQKDSAEPQELREANGE